MREPTKTSPFAALSPQEQKEQWIGWQCQHPAGQRETDLTAAPTLPKEIRTDPPQQPAPAPRHDQYNAVLRRMREAGKHAGDYQSWQG